MNTISVCMIVKNEQDVLFACLNSLVKIADEFVIVDTGSTDDTKRIARNFTDKVYDFPWINDFAAARNFAFSKCTCDYIYSVDADEVLDELNQNKLLQLKQMMLSEIDIVQMKYVNAMPHRHSYESKVELRPKLFKRLRTFTWVDPINETVVLEPVIYDSDIEIKHMAVGDHSGRNLELLRTTFMSGKPFSAKLHNTYAKQLFTAGRSLDFLNAQEVFEETIAESTRTVQEKKEAACVLARCYRLSNDINNFFKICLRDMVATPCAEICIELGEYFFSQSDYNEAAIWFQNAAYETQSMVYARSSGDLPRRRLGDSYMQIAGELERKRASREEVARYLSEAEKMSNEADAWQMQDRG